nr:YHYH protein [Rhodoferax sp.]
MQIHLDMLRRSVSRSIKTLLPRWVHVGGAAVIAGLCMAACGGGGSSSAVAATPTPVSIPTSTTPTTASSSAVDATKLPIGDGRYSQTGPAVGSVYVCYGAGMGGASSKGPWFNADGLTWNALGKISVQGSVGWASNFLVSLGSTLGITGNGLPPNPTGTFPIASSDPAYAYDRNPNSIKASAIAWGLPASPAVASSPTCLGLGAIGVLLDGVRLFSADDGAHRDAVAWEVQDACQGHPERTGQYHHHSVTTCLSQKDSAGLHSPLVGYIADGFGLYGNLGEGGKALTNADLDTCHGHTHVITVNGAAVSQYHYHQTQEFPYTVGCFKGKPVALN